ncbi:MAG: hypothetical protein QM791_12180 [Ferruginibacter sp.]
MNNSKITIILIVLISIVLFVLGLFLFGNIYEILLPKPDNGFYQETASGGQFKRSLIFAVVFGLTPIFIWATWRLAPITLKLQKNYTILTVIVCILLAVVLRQQLLKLYFSRFTNNINSTTANLHVGYPIDKVYFEYYMFGGLIMGCLISYLLFRQRKTY